MAVVDLIDWDSKDDNIFVWRFPNNSFSTETKLLVRENQEAILFGNGRVIGKVGPGEYVLNNSVFPLLEQTYGIAAGTQVPFKAEVWFVNKGAPLVLDWRTPSVQYMDPQLKKKAPLFAQGQCVSKIIDSSVLLLKLGFRKKILTSRDIKDFFMKPLSERIINLIVSYMLANNIGVSQIEKLREPLNVYLEAPVKEFWEGYGLNLESFIISFISLDVSVSSGKKFVDAVKEAYAKNVNRIAVWKKQIANLKKKSQPVEDDGNISISGFSKKPLTEVYCSNCAKKYPVTSKFCPYCGNPYNPCPVCGNDNDLRAKRCMTCGADLVPQNMVNCGSNVCPNCQTTVKPGIKFCPNCGHKIF